MNIRPIISFVLSAHAPFAHHPELINPAEELWLFESISETFIPLLEVFDRLDRDMVPFRMAISISPILCQMLGNEHIIRRYLEYTDKQLAFGVSELERTADEPELNALAKFHFDRIAEKKAFFSGRCEHNLIKAFDNYQKKGRIEILTTAATYAFLPHYTAHPEAIQAQCEVAVSTYRSHFGRLPQGFWLPELGWKAELDYWLRAYNFDYTVVDTHALIFARPFAEKGSFFPVRTPQGLVALGRDFYAAEDIKKISGDPVFRDNCRDQGFELPLERVESFLGSRKSRRQTGYKYRASGGGLYDPDEALSSVKNNARSFLDALLPRLGTASALMDVPALSLCAFDADSFGRFWHEGPMFIETIFREGIKSDTVQFMTPAEYYCKLDSGVFQQIMPEFSSWGANGYAETWLDASNDWMYRHVMRALDRMGELVERFPDDSGLKERALNQAAREILLATASDWAKMLYNEEHEEYARSRVKTSLRNFTTIYEALGSNYVSTEWLTQLEKRHNIFPSINYRVFRRRG